MDIALEVVAFINSSALQQNPIIASLRWLFLMWGSFFLVVIVFVMTTNQTWREMNIFVDLTELIAFRSPGMRRIGRKWRKVMARMETSNEAEYKLAIIEADTILGDALSKMNLSGETTEQRLQQATKIMIPTIDDLRAAHLVRNDIVYDPDYRVSLSDARRVLEIYETAFKGLDLMS